jgi:hypothetical protein
MPASCFPHAAGAQRMDLDHTDSYVPLARGGPHGQTGVHGLGPWAERNTASKPTAAGGYDNPNPVSGSGDHRTGISTSSPTPEPTISAMDLLRDESGKAAANIALTLSRLARSKTDGGGRVAT